MTPAGDSVFPEVVDRREESAEVFSNVTRVAQGLSWRFGSGMSLVLAMRVVVSKLWDSISVDVLNRYLIPDGYWLLVGIRAMATSTKLPSSNS
jgi:hypothetical protein